MGAPKGNRNAVKHGIYSQFIHKEDDQLLAGMSNSLPADELDLAKVRLVKLLLLADAAAASDIETFLRLDYGVRHYLEIILNAKAKATETEELEAEVWDTFMAAIDKANQKRLKR